MSNKIRDLTRQVFGRLTVISAAGQDKYKAVLWLCQCYCGKKTIVRGASLISGATQSCGCLHREKAKECHTTHGLSIDPATGKESRLFRIWKRMVNRCTNPEDDGYFRYGGRGIQVCNEWLDVTNFFEWTLANGYQDDLTIDRRDNDGNYEPDNCRWATQAEQSRNKSNNVFLTYKGQTMCLADWERNLGFKKSTLSGRLRNGKTIGKIYEASLMKKKKQLLRKY